MSHSNDPLSAPTTEDWKAGIILLPDAHNLPTGTVIRFPLFFHPVTVFSTSSHCGKLMPDRPSDFFRVRRTLKTLDDGSVISFAFWEHFIDSEQAQSEPEKDSSGESK